jgi:hypothetical protein
MEVGVSHVSLGSYNTSAIRKKLSDRQDSLFSKEHDDAEVWVAGDKIGKSFCETTRVNIFISQYEKQGLGRKSCDAGSYQRAPEQGLGRILPRPPC